jgi:lipoprotein-releasing system ATP-binding protein
MQLGTESEQGAFRLADVSHSFQDNQPLFRPLDLEFQAGRVYALLGPSGSGKSTLLGIIAGQIRPTHGIIRGLEGLSVGWVFQNPAGAAGRTALDHVTLPLLARGSSRRSANAEGIRLLARFGLLNQARTEFRHLSGGEAQRLLLARAVAYAPDILLVDEPTAQLDLRSAHRVNDILSEVSSGGSVVIVATHDPQTAERCDEQIVLRLP